MPLFKRTILSPLHCRVTFVITQVTVYACICQFLDSLLFHWSIHLPTSWAKDPLTVWELETYCMQINNKISANNSYKQHHTHLRAWAMNRARVSDQTVRWGCPQGAAGEQDARRTLSRKEKLHQPRESVHLAGPNKGWTVPVTSTEAERQPGNQVRRKPGVA